MVSSNRANIRAGKLRRGTISAVCCRRNGLEIWKSWLGLLGWYSMDGGWPCFLSLTPFGGSERFVDTLRLHSVILSDHSSRWQFAPLPDCGCACHYYHVVEGYLLDHAEMLRDDVGPGLSSQHVTLGLSFPDATSRGLYGVWASPESENSCQRRKLPLRISVSTSSHRLGTVPELYRRGGFGGAASGVGRNYRVNHS